MELEARHLRAVCAIADYGSVTRAAAALGMSQPAVTRQIQRMERALGGPLFARGGSGSTPTALGEHVLARARAVLPALDELNAEIGNVSGGHSGMRDIRYGAESGPLAAGLLPALRTLHPSAAVKLRTGLPGATLAELVASGHLDLAAICEFPGYEARLKSDVDRQVVVTEPMFVLLADNHPLASRQEVALADLADACWALEPPGGDRFREYFTELCQAAGFTPDVRYEIDFGSSRDLISAGQVVAFGQPTFRPVPGISVRPLAGAPVWQAHTLIWLRHGPLAGARVDLRDAGREVYRGALARSPIYQRWLARHPEHASLVTGEQRSAL